MTKKEIKILKEEILKYLCEDFKGNQAIFNKQYGWQVFNGTDLTMVMDKVVGGLYSGMKKINGK
ncbi:MAG: hypothetical protein J6T15_05245 [Bacilli bacterium]|nr:hypothetical protein [Bacilli bacterium]